MRQHGMTPHEWQVVEHEHLPEQNEFLESIFALGNGYMGVRGTPDEGFSGSGTTPATYVSSVYDLVRSGADRHVPYVTHCTIMVDNINWFLLQLKLGGRRFDPREGRVLSYRRALDLRGGVLRRSLTWADERGRCTELSFTRIVSMADLHVGAVRVVVTPLNWSGPVEVLAGLDARHAKQQRQAGAGMIGRDGAFLRVQTLETKFETAVAMRLSVRDGGGAAIACKTGVEREDRYIARRATFRARRGQSCVIDKLVAVCASRDKQRGQPGQRALAKAAACLAAGFDRLQTQHEAAWAHVWKDSDIAIGGDVAAQQAIRFCVFQMHQSYAGTDPLVNIPAKGLSGPGYGGLYWWDTEAYMVPFFLLGAAEKARTLLLYRYHTLDGARWKAKLFGYRGAMYPWVTIDGIERSGDWEYGMLEQHVASAVTYAIRQYVETTGDEDFLWDYGVEMVVETSRFWASRAHYSPRKRRYVINFITGPDEYAVGVNNNCYTNYMAMRNLEYGLAVVARMRRREPARWRALARKLAFRDEELAQWRDTARRMFIPFDRKLGIHEQDDSFLDREDFDIRKVDAKTLPAGRWMWDKLMRSQAMKQADVLLLMFKEGDRFSPRVKRANYAFYEPKCTHESSLSPCIHAAVAAELGLEEDAFRYYLRSARLDLDDVNGNTNQGLHTASLAGSWMSVVYGFGGFRLVQGEVCFQPLLPRRWKRLAFSIRYRGRRIGVDLSRGRARFSLEGAPLRIRVGRQRIALRAGKDAVVAL